MQIVDQGVNPDLLRTLYIELGIQVTFPSPSQSQQSAENGLSSQDASTTHAATPNEEYPAKAIDSTLSNPVLVDKDVNRVNNPSPVVNTNTEGQIPVASPTVMDTLRKPANKTVLIKPSGPKTAESKSLDRKEYIARMLAAKTGKPISTNSPTAAPSKTPTTTPSALATPAPVLTTAAALNLPAVRAVAQDTSQNVQGKVSDAVMQSQKDEAEAEAKRKAQTDLARQKIEALKIQQETRKATASDSLNQKQATAGQVSSQVPVPVRVTVPQPPLPSRQGSYFSPISQKAPFNLPGLFMSADPADSAKHLEERPNQPVASAHPAEPSQQVVPTTAVAPSRENTTNGDNTIVLVDPISKPPTNRKRQKASDFLDSPTIKVKKPLVQQEDSGFIINISDDEMMDVSDVESMVMPSSKAQVLAQPEARPGDKGITSQKTMKEFPPLNDFPPNRKTPGMTPPRALPIEHVKGLKTKEMQIQQMNRKIAELEQRVSAKKMSSRAQTPTASRLATLSPPPRKISLDGGDLSEISVKVPHEAGSDSDNGEAKQSPLTASEKADTVAAEEALHEVELAKAEAERSLAVDVANASKVNQELQLRESLLTQEGELTLSEEAPHTQSPDHVSPQVVEKPNRDNEQQPPPLSEDLNRSQQQDLHLQALAKEQLLREEHKRSQEVQMQLQDEQRLQRRVAIESGLPMLDATNSTARQRLESLRSQVEDLELEVRKGVERRQALVEELMSLSDAQMTTQKINEQSLSDVGGAMERTGLREERNCKCLLSLKSFSSPILKHGITKKSCRLTVNASSPIGMTDDTFLSRQQNSEPANRIQDAVSRTNSTTPVSPQISMLASQGADVDAVEGELEEDVMDLSHSDEDEPNDPNRSRNPSDSDSQQSTSPFDDEENYEPPMSVSVQRQPENELSVDQHSLDTNVLGTEVSAVTGNVTVPVSNNNSEPQVVDEPSHGGKLSSAQQSPRLSQSLVVVSDSDDYEPPEPLSSMSEDVVLSEASPADLQPTFTQPTVNSEDGEGRVQSASQLGLSQASAVVKVSAATSQAVRHRCCLLLLSVG